MGMAWAQESRIHGTERDELDPAPRGARGSQLTKFRPPTLPATLITRSALHERLMAGAGQRLTAVVGSAGRARACCWRTGPRRGHPA